MDTPVCFLLFLSLHLVTPHSLSAILSNFRYSRQEVALEALFDVLLLEPHDLPRKEDIKILHMRSPAVSQV